MAEKRKQVSERDITGLKYFRRLLPLFEQLYEVGCLRDKAGNRTLHADQYCALVLLFLFNPCLRSLRALQQTSELKNVQKKLENAPRTSRTTERRGDSCPGAAVNHRVALFRR